MCIKSGIIPAVAVLAALAVGGCSFSTTPGKPPQAEWIGTHQARQAAESDQDRATALRVRKTLENDSVLAPLGLSVFVDHGHVRLCGRFPDPATRERASGLVGTLKGVASVDTHCGK